MGKQNRKQAPAQKPLSSHPLFPAIVAMWFGALFGLGSLAVRASLLEAIVIAGHIDTLVPSAAPPLGITARIMLALAMAMIGGTLGALIARWIARPKPAAHERRRTVAPSAASIQKRTSFGLSEPVPAQPYAQANEAKQATPVFTGRRRPLTIEEDSFQAYVHDGAPLPGGPPQILDVTEFDLAEAQFEDAEIVRHAPAIAPYDVQPLDLSAFDLPGDSRFEQPQTETAAVAAIAEPAAGQFAEPAATALPDAAPLACDAAAGPSAPVEPQAEDEAAPPLAEDSAGMPPQSFAAPPLALQRFAAMGALPGSFGPPPAIATLPFGLPLDEAGSAGTQDILRGADAAPAGEGPEATVDRLADAEMSAPAELALPEGRAAQRLVTAVLAELSPVELIERLALTLQNRKIVTTRTGQLASAAPSALAAASEPDGAFPATALLAAVETAFPAPAEDRAAPDAPSPLQLTIPAALRPIDFREYEDADDSLALAPPRSISMPPAAAGDPEEPSTAPLGQDSGETAGAEAEGPDAGEAVVEDAYSSLLDLARPVASRQQFVRIDEAEDDSAEIEPVVIFPGQAGPTGGRFSAPEPKPVADEAAAEVAAPDIVPAVRRFDVPGYAPAAGPAQPAAGAPGLDAAETEQALRSALASLQRMSGAA